MNDDWVKDAWDLYEKAYPYVTAIKATDTPWTPLIVNDESVNEWGLPV